MPRPASLVRKTAIFIFIAALLLAPARAIDDNLTKGATNNHIFEAGIWGENIDLLNGGLTLSIPIGPRYVVSPDVSYQLVLAYSSKIWQMNDSNTANYARSRLQGRGQAGLGFGLHFGRRYEYSGMTDCGTSELVFEDSTGAAHSGTGVLTDGSFLRVQPPIITAPHGTMLTLGHQVNDLYLENLPPPLPQYGCASPATVDYQTNEYRGVYVTQLAGKDKDAGGQPYNHVDIVYENSPGKRHLIDYLTDSRGRRIEFYNDISRTVGGTLFDMGYVERIEVPAFGANPPAVYQFVYQTMNVLDPFTLYEYLDLSLGQMRYAKAFDNPNDLFENVKLLKKIIFPHNYEMNFEYNEFGQLTARVLPTGARIEYEYQEYTFDHETCWKERSGPACIGQYCYEIPACGSETFPGTFGVSVKRILPEPVTAPQVSHEYRYRRVAEPVFVGGQILPVKPPNPQKVIVTDPFGNDIVTHFYSVPPAGGTLNYNQDPNLFPNNDPQWMNGLSYRTEYYRGPSSTPLNLVRSETQGWEDTSTPLTAERRYHSGAHKRVTDTSTIYHDDGNRSRRTENREWDGYGNFREITEFGFDGLPYRIHRKDYNCDNREPGGQCMAADTYNYNFGDPATLHCPLSEAHYYNWILGTHTYSETLDPNQTVLQRSEFLFDDLGYLKAQEDFVSIPPDPELATRRGDPLQGPSENILTTYCYEGEPNCAGGVRPGGSGNLQSKRVSLLGADQQDPEQFTEEVYTYTGPFLSTRQIAGISWLTESNTIDLKTGLPSASRDPSGVETSFTYDLLGRLKSVTPTEPEIPAYLSYPAIRETVLSQQLDADNWLYSEFHFDSFGRLESVDKLQPDFGFATQVMRYDVAGRLTYKSEWVLRGTIPSGGAPPNLGTTYDYLDPLSDPAAPTSDPFGRIRRVTTADGKVTRTDYSGLSSSVTVEGIQGVAGQIQARTVYTKDAFDRLTEVLSPRISAGARTAADAHYTYDRLDRLVGVRLEDVDAGGNVLSQYRSFTFDALGRLLSSTNPENGTVLNKRYDHLGNLRERQDAAGNLLAYSYDKASRITEITGTPFGDFERPLVIKRYDETTPGFFGASAGKLTTAISFDGSWTQLAIEQRRYEGLNGRMSSRSWRISGWDPSPNVGIETQPELVMGYTYDNLGMLKSMVYPENPSVPRTKANPINTYANGLVQRIDDLTRGVLVESIQYNSARGIRKIRTRGGVETDIPADVRNRPYSIMVTGPAPPPPPPSGGGGGGIIVEGGNFAFLGSPARLIGQSSPPVMLFYSGNYSYDGAGNISAIGSDTFRYDAVNRLAAAEVWHNGVAHAMSWSYDAFGNMESQSRTENSQTTTAYFDMTPTRNQIAQYRVVSDLPLLGKPPYNPEYDGNGNLTHDRDFDYAFDIQSRLLAISRKDGSAVSRAAYDCEGYRLYKQDPSTGATTFYLRDTSGQVLSEFRRPGGTGAQPTWFKDYIYAGNRHVALFENETPATPGGIAATASNPAETPWVRLTWAKNPDLDLVRYRIHRQLGAATQVFNHTNLSDTSWNDTGVVEGQTYSYRVTAVDAAAAESDFSESIPVMPGDGSQPAAPLLYSPVEGDHSVELTWSDPVPADSTEPWGYYVYRMQVGIPNAPWEQKGGLFRETRVTDLTALNNSTYRYRVEAIDTAGRHSDPSNEIEARPEDRTPPGQPQALSGISGTTTVELTWRRNPEPDAVFYYVLRNNGPVELSTPVHAVTGNPMFVDSANVAPDGAEYHYRIRAVDFWGNLSPMSEEIVVFTKYSSVAPPGLLSLLWDYCPSSTAADPILFGIHFQFCVLPQNASYSNPPTLTNHENQRETTISWASSDANATFRIYSRRLPEEPFQFSRSYPVNWSSVRYPLTLSDPARSPDFWYRDYAPDATDACQPVTYRVSAMTSDGRESSLSAPLSLEPSLLRPENLQVLAEPLPRDPDNLAQLVPDIIRRPEHYGLTLAWTKVNSPCGVTFKGHHVYRNRWDGSAFSSATLPPIRLSGSALDVTSFRVNYLPISRRTRTRGLPDFAGPLGPQVGPSIPATYRVTSVDVYGNESPLSNGVRAHTNAEQDTEYDTLPCSLPCPYNEEYEAEYFSLPTLNSFSPPGPPTNLRWDWFYGERDGLLRNEPPGRNWALVRWDLPSPSTANSFHLLRKRTADQSFTEVPLASIAGDDGGIRQFIWSMDPSLACQEADYKVKAVDIFGRSDAAGSESAPVHVFRHRLVPENVRFTAWSQTDLTLSWDPLPNCGQEADFALAQYVIHRSSIADTTAGCDPAGPANDVAGTWQEIYRGSSAAPTSVSITPEDPTGRYWYRIKAVWGSLPGVESSFSIGACASLEEGPLNQMSSIGVSPAGTGNDAEFIAEGLGDSHRDFVPARFHSAYPGALSPYRTIGQSNPAVKLYFYHLDHLGTPRVITNVAGQPVSRHKYLPFGEELSPPPSTNTHEFTGHQRDAETGLDYMLARYYGQATINRFLSTDPLEYANIIETSAFLADSGNWNKYSYALNNPALLIDKTGEVVNYTDAFRRELRTNPVFREAHRRVLANTEGKTVHDALRKSPILFVFTVASRAALNQDNSIPGTTVTGITNDPGTKNPAFINIFISKEAGPAATEHAMFHERLHGKIIAQMPEDPLGRLIEHALLDFFLGHSPQEMEYQGQPTEPDSTPPPILDPNSVPNASASAGSHQSLRVDGTDRTDVYGPR